ncbi:hypothetical protein KC340_g158 [Hortaea werneckii]|nr:hypothetical protein KC340_g158 [Hortaea werneckii]
MSVLGPGRGPKFQGAPPVGGVLPATGGDRGVRGHVSSGGLDNIGSRPRRPVIGLMEGDWSGVCKSELPSSSIANIMSFDEALAFRAGRSRSDLR